MGRSCIRASSRSPRPPRRVRRARHPPRRPPPGRPHPLLRPATRPVPIRQPGRPATRRQKGRRAMANETPQQILDKAEAAVKLANEALQAAHAHVAEVAGTAAQVATGGAVDPFVFRLAIFVLAVFVGYYVVWSVTP